MTAVRRVKIPDEPADYAVATFKAWRRGDLAALSQLAVPSVVEFLAAHPPERGRWGRPQCEGAAGSTFCAWTRLDVQFVLRIANETAFAGQPHAVVQAFFVPAPG